MTQHSHGGLRQRLRPGSWPILCGHRGAPSLATENTLESFAAAIAAGASMIEFDVRLSQCGTAMVFHDETLARLAGQDTRVDALDLGALRALDQVTIPTLEDVLDWSRQRCDVIVELKERRAVQATLTALRRTGTRADAWVESFDALTVRALGREGAGLFAGLLLDPNDLPSPPTIDTVAWVMVETGASFIAPHHQQVARAWVVTCRANLGPVVTWTVNTPEVFDVMVDAGVDVVISDVPQTCAARAAAAQR